MPSFTAIALDRLLEPGASKSVDKTIPSSNPIPKPKALPKVKPVPNSNLERRNSTSTVERKASRPQISPALYATPEATPLPDSPSSFPPSPYIINHKRRGPRLLKSFSEDDVASRREALDKDKVNGNGKFAGTEVVDSTKNHSLAISAPGSIEGEHVNGVHDSPIEKEHANGVHDGPIQGEHMNGFHDDETGISNGKLGSCDLKNALALGRDAVKVVALNLERDGEYEDFFDPQESMSCTSNTDGEDNTGAESSAKPAASTPMGEFFDAWEELSSEGGPQPSLHDVDAELREIRLSLFMEIERRKQAEETLNNMQSQWQRIRQELSLVGLSLPSCPIDVSEGDQPQDINPAEELCQQVHLARFVSDSIGRGIAKAEVEMEMEAQIEAKNFEIARLWDRLQYYEAMNREMSQRNQEAVEMARRDRQVRKRRQRWVWGSIATAITLGTAALAWSYIPAARGSSSTSGSPAPEHDDATK